MKGKGVFYNYTIIRVCTYITFCSPNIRKYMYRFFTINELTHLQQDLSTIFVMTSLEVSSAKVCQYLYIVVLVKLLDAVFILEGKTMSNG